MNWNRVAGNWKQFSGKIQARWGRLSDDDLAVIAGNRMRLAMRIEELYGIGKDAAEKQIDDWLGLQS